MKDEAEEGGGSVFSFSFGSLRLGGSVTISFSRSAIESS